MSDQDMFGDSEDNNPDDPCPLLSQVEFSGISGSGSSASPSSQQVQQPVPLCAPSIPGPSTSSSAVSTTCALCKKVFQSVRGLKTHITRSHKGESVPLSTVPTLVQPQTAPNPIQGQTFVCSDCKAQLTTQNGFLRHRATHKLKDVFERMPQASDFKAEALEETMVELLRDISREPSYGCAQKKDFVQGMIDCKGSAVWWTFVSMLSDFICNLVFKAPSKIMPGNQYEEFLKCLNSFLNENDIDLQEKLKCVCPQVEISCPLAGRLIFRIASKLLQKVQIWVLQKVQSARESEVHPTSLSPVTFMSENEIKAFHLHLRDIFQQHYKKSKSLCPRQSECLKNNFVNGLHPISTSQFLDKKNWFSGEEHCITLSSRASDFFIAIEVQIIPSIQSSLGEVTTQAVIEKVLESQALLDDWFYLTNDFLSEDLSLVFMRDLVRGFVRSSLLLEEKKKNRAEEQTIRATSVALRTHLQKNYVEKDDGNEDVD